VLVLTILKVFFDRHNNFRDEVTTARENLDCCITGMLVVFLASACTDNLKSIV
jgi:hypothetical protein